MTLIEAILVTILTASVPLVIAAIGELVVERSGVLNLGVEGMMIMGAACGIAAAILTGSAALGLLAAIAAGMAMAALFALLTLGLAANQVATGLALAIFGVGLSGVLGSGFVGVQREGIGPWPFVLGGFALAGGTAWFLGRTRAGMVLRACGENHAAAHALGHPVRRIRLLALLFGGGCAGLAGGYLSLSYTPFWTSGLTGGRGWIALAIVVFASWRPWRAVLGAHLFGGATILQLHAQGFGVPVPSQLLAALPYLVTILALVLIMRLRRGSAAGPASLGQPFVPDR